MTSALVPIPYPIANPVPITLADAEDDDAAPTIGQQIAELRERVGLSQMDVAVLCGVDVSTISRWECNRHKHTHRSKDRQIRAALQALTWAAELQDEDPMRVLTRAEVQEYIERRERQRQRRVR